MLHIYTVVNNTHLQETIIGAIGDREYWVIHPIPPTDPLILGDSYIFELVFGEFTTTEYIDMLDFVLELHPEIEKHYDEVN